MKSIPTNLITGFLGVGKTTTVINLLKNKPPQARWAVLVNEYGQVGIDGAWIDSAGVAGVTVQEVAGGCVCCAAAPFLPVAIHLLLLEARPERLLIETTGLGHPARLIDSLRHNYHGRLEVRATLGLVAPADFAQATMRENPIFVEQIQLADVLILNKLDTATPALVQEFQTWAESLYPPKLLVAGTTYGQLDAAWLDLRCDDERQFTLGGHVQPTGAHEAATKTHQGWRFEPTVVFDAAKLLDLLANTPAITRLKGVFRVADEWIAVNRVGSALTVNPTAYRRDSRLEVFASHLNWERFEKQLYACQSSELGPPMHDDA
ncbi:MAG: GTP-binding protein [Gemmataceae bacterium]|nr:GTP-binding protein [Gemmata sp.]MDW8197782.1 GTP-binding protein [Gemmataceae bacterium]